MHRTTSPWAPLLLLPLMSCSLLFSEAAERGAEDGGASNSVDSGPIDTDVDASTATDAQALTDGNSGLDAGASCADLPLLADTQMCMSFDDQNLLQVLSNVAGIVPVGQNLTSVTGREDCGQAANMQSSVVRIPHNDAFLETTRIELSFFAGPDDTGVLLSKDVPKMNNDGDLLLHLQKQAGTLRLRLRLEASGTGNKDYAICTAAVTANQWHKVVITLDASSGVKLLLDGTAASTPCNTESPGSDATDAARKSVLTTNQQDWILGAVIDGNGNFVNRFNGVIDSVCFSE